MRGGGETGAPMPENEGRIAARSELRPGVGTPGGDPAPPGPELSVGDATREPFPGIGSVPNLVWAYGIAGGAWCCGLLGRFLPGNVLWIALAAVVAGVLVWVSVRVLPLGWRKWMAPVTREQPVDHAARVGVLVSPDEVGAVRTRLERDRGGFFEPELIRPVLGVTKGRAAVVPWLAVSLVVLVLSVLLDRKLPGWSLLPKSGFPSFFHLALAFAAGGVVSDWLVPVYFTLTPGRLEVHTYGLLGRGEPRVTTCDLTTARVRISERARTFSVLPPGAHWVSDRGPRAWGPGAGIGASMRLTPGGMEFIRRLEAASLGASEPLDGAAGAAGKAATTPGAA